MYLTARQEAILTAVVEQHHATGRPVGSKALVELGAVEASPATVRSELNRLEELGLLEHPHTSAGRIPTDLGYRTYVDRLLENDRCRPTRAQLPIVASVGATQIDDALRETTQALAEATGLLAVITAPRASGAVIRHVEVLQLQPTMLVVVVITAAGDVVRHVVHTDSPVDGGLVDWAVEYLNEQVVGITPGQSLLRQRLLRSDLMPAERAMLALVAPAFATLAAEEQQDVHIGGSAVLLAELGDDVQRVVNLVAMLDERRRLLAALRPLAGSGIAAVQPIGQSVAVRIGGENDIPELHRLSVVGASYGVTARPLGMVGVIGPRAMNYLVAVQAVHAVSDGLSGLADGFYGESDR
ncbi:MAG: heat-inducible transcription repressor HrcA [Thermoleophilia bacterium]|nr:heat-inducible transcription repressor HrcA [Thermoleophilia bacterium]